MRVCACPASLGADWSCLELQHVPVCVRACVFYIHLTVQLLGTYMSARVAAAQRKPTDPYVWHNLRRLQQL